jgi:hypothetical protein
VYLDVLARLPQSFFILGGCLSKNFDGGEDAIAMSVQHQG